MIAGTAWTPEEDAALLAARESGTSLNDLPKAVEGRTRGACERRLHMLQTRARLHADRRPPSFVPVEIPDGLTFEEVTKLLGRTRSATIGLLSSYGYRLRGDRYFRGPSAMQIEDRISAIRANAPPSAPCFYCGGRVCSCAVRKAA